MDEVVCALLRAFPMAHLRGQSKLSFSPHAFAAAASRTPLRPLVGVYHLTRLDAETCYRLRRLPLMYEELRASLAPVLL